MSTKPTKGKWWVHYTGTSYRVVTDDLPVASIYQNYPHDSTDKANAHLIAASKDLLAACEAWKKAFTAGEVKTQDLGTSIMLGDAIELTKAAIAKATP